MSHLMTALAMQVTGLKPATKIVLYWLADCHNFETDECFPSVKTLAEKCEMSRRSVIAHLEELERLGHITRLARTRKNGSQTSNAYVLNFSEGCAKSAPPPMQNLHPLPVQNLHPHNLGNITLEEGTYSIAQNWDFEAPQKNETERAVEAYNEIASRVGWQKKRTKLLPDQKSRLKVRIREAGGVSSWIAEIERAGRSAFLRGEVTDFKATFNFFLQAKSFAKLMDGDYDDNTRNTSKQRFGGHSGLIEGLAQNASRYATEGADFE